MGGALSKGLLRALGATIGGFLGVAILAIGNQIAVRGGREGLVVQQGTRGALLMALFAAAPCRDICMLYLQHPTKISVSLRPALLFVAGGRLGLLPLLLLPPRPSHHPAHRRLWLPHRRAQAALPAHRALLVCHALRHARGGGRRHEVGGWVGDGTGVVGARTGWAGQGSSRVGHENCLYTSCTQVHPRLHLPAARETTA